MIVNIVGRHLTVTPEVQGFAEERFAKLDRYFAGVRKVDVILTLDGHGHSRANVAEATVVLAPGTHLVGKGEGDDMMAAIDQAEGRLQKQLRRFHARLKSHRDRRRTAGNGESGREEDEEETYEQVVREMLDEGEQ